MSSKFCQTLASQTQVSIFGSINDLSFSHLHQQQSCTLWYLTLVTGSIFVEHYTGKILFLWTLLWFHLNFKSIKALSPTIWVGWIYILRFFLWVFTLSLSLQALQQLGQDSYSTYELRSQRCQMCLRSDSLHKVMERLANPGKAYFVSIFYFI